MGGVCTQLDVQTSNVSTFPTYPLSFHSVPHSFALTKTSTRLFSSDSALFAKNARGWGIPYSFGTAKSCTPANARNSHDFPPVTRPACINLVGALFFFNFQLSTSVCPQLVAPFQHAVQ